jgi:peroxiredoxin
MCNVRSRCWAALCAAVLLSVLLPVPVVLAADSDKTPGLEAGAPAPDFSLKGTDGKDVSLKSFSGKVILLSFWDCYSDVCFTSVDALDRMAKKYSPEQFAVITICYEVPPSMAADGYKNLLKSCSIGQIILLDVEKKARDAFQVKEGASTFLIGRDLVIKERINGIPTLRGAEFARRVDDLVSTPANTYRIPIPPPDDPDRPPAPVQPEDQPAPRP